MRKIRVAEGFPPELELYTSLKENQLYHFLEPAPGLFIAESAQIIGLALAAGYEPYSFLLEEGKEEELEKLLEMNHGNLPWDVPVYITEKENLCSIAGYSLTGGMLGAFFRKPLPKAEEILKGARRVVCLEGVMNPRNVGSVFRSAAAIGFDAVLLSKGATDPLYRRAARVSMGTVFQIPWTFVSDWKVLEKEGFTTVAMALTGRSVPMDDPVLKGHEKLAVFMGSEREGLKEETVRMLDYTAKIPMKHGVDSLNVAAAAAVAFWELR